MQVSQSVHDTDDARTRIRRAAEALFAARGFDGASIRTIATEAGVTNPVIYHYFGNKEGLFRSILLHAAHELMAAVEATRLCSTRPIEELATVVNVLCRFATDHLDLFRIVYRELADSSTEQDSVLGDQLTVLIQHIRDVIRRTTASGAFRAVDAESASLVILGGIEALVGWQLVWRQGAYHGVRAPEEAADHLISLLWHGLEARGPMLPEPS